jgi:SPP1 gp7 family putative phage head morphogenesis protein
MAEPWQRLPFEEQIAFLAERVNVPTDSYRDVSGAEHDAAFVVAGAKGAVLNDFRSAVDRAIATGQTLEQFRQEFDSIVERTGWTFRGGSAWRANVIWDTNLRTSYAAGRYEQMQQVTTSRPYWQWRHGGSAHPRPQHLALDGKVFRHDDPFWSSFGSPPQGYGCRCSVFTLSDRDLERRGLAAEPGPQLGDRLPIPDLPGQTTAMNPPAGWGHLHGSSGPEHRAQLLDAVTRRLDPAIAAQVRAEAAAYQPKPAPQPAATPASPASTTVPPSLKGDPNWNPNAKTDLTPGQFREYVDARYWQKNQDNPTAAHNLSWDEYKAANPRARKGDYQTAVKDAVSLNGYIPIDAALASVKFNKAEQSRLEQAREAAQGRNRLIADIDQAINAPLMPGDSTRGWKPQMTPTEAAAYLQDSYFGTTRFYHGNRRSITDDIAGDGAKPWLNDKGIYGQGTYFGVDRGIGELYAKAASQNGNVEVGLVTSHIKANNPYVVTSADLDALGASFPGSQTNGVDSATLTAFLKARGHDSIYLTDLGYGVAFDQRQVVTVENERLSQQLDRIVIDPSVSAKDLLPEGNESAATLRSAPSRVIAGDPLEDEWMGLGDLDNYNPGAVSEEEDWGGDW